jgi:hypothetical protein
MRGSPESLELTEASVVDAPFSDDPFGRSESEQAEVNRGRSQQNIRCHLDTYLRPVEQALVNEWFIVIYDTGP